MERWTFDLDRIRKNWERTSTPEVAAEKFCPACGAELPRGAPSLGKIAAGALGSAAPRVTAEKLPPTVTGSVLAALADPSRAIPARFAQVAAPRDPYPDVRSLLARIRGLVQRQLAPHEPILRPFLDEAADILERLAATPAEGEDPPDKKKLRADLDRVIADLEDLIAVWSGIGR